jgi:hypothetical protein
MIRFNCPNCGAGLRVAGDHTSRRVKCLECGGRVAIPRSHEEEAAPAAVRDDRGPSGRRPARVFAIVTALLVTLFVTVLIVATRPTRPAEEPPPGETSASDRQTTPGDSAAFPVRVSEKLAGVQLRDVRVRDATGFARVRSQFGLMLGAAPTNPLLGSAATLVPPEPPRTLLSGRLTAGATGLKRNSLLVTFQDQTGRAVDVGFPRHPAIPANGGADVAFECLSAGRPAALILAPAPSGEWLNYSGHTGRFDLFATGGLVTAVGFSPDGRWLLTAGGELRVKLWELCTGNLVREFKTRDRVHLLALSPDRKVLVTGTDDWDFQGGTIVRRAATRVVQVWDVEGGRESWRLTGHTSSVNAVAISPDARYVASAGGDSEFKPDSKRWVTTDATARCWDLHTGREVFRTPEHPARVQHLSFAPDGRTIRTIDGKAGLMEWDVGRNCLHRSHPFVLTPRDDSGPPGGFKPPALVVVDPPDAAPPGNRRAREGVRERVRRRPGGPQDAAGLVESDEADRPGGALPRRGQGLSGVQRGLRLRRGSALRDRLLVRHREGVVRGRRDTRVARSRLVRRLLARRATPGGGGCGGESPASRDTGRIAPG